MPYWTLHYHLIWATFERQPLLDAEREAIVRTTFHSKAVELRAVLHAVGNVPDHVHVVASIPPAWSVAAFVKHLKGASSRAANLRTRTGRRFRWQEGYGALSVGGRSLATVVSYVRNQPQHHRQGTTVNIYDQLLGAGFEDSGDYTGHFLYLRDQQPVIIGATYQYFVMRLNAQHEVSEIIPAGSVTIPPN